jgi:hypothetical protein
MHVFSTSRCPCILGFIIKFTFTGWRISLHPCYLYYCVYSSPALLLRMMLPSFIIFSFTQTHHYRYFAFEKDDLSPGLINFGDTSVKVKCT